MLKNEKLRDVRIAFIFSSTLKKDKFFSANLNRDNWSAWTKSSRNKDEMYYWGIEEKRRKVCRTKDQLSSALEDYILELEKYEQTVKELKQRFDFFMIKQHRQLALYLAGKNDCIDGFLAGDAYNEKEMLESIQKAGH